MQCKLCDVVGRIAEIWKDFLRRRERKGTIQTVSSKITEVQKKAHNFLLETQTRKGFWVALKTNFKPLTQRKLNEREGEEN